MCIGILLCHTEQLLVIPRAERYGIFMRKLHIYNIMVNCLIDPCKYLHYSGVTDMFVLSFCYKLANPVVPPSD